MVKWYNGCLPSNSRGFDYPWPHIVFDTNQTDKTQKDS